MERRIAPRVKSLTARIATSGGDGDERRHLDQPETFVGHARRVIVACIANLDFEQTQHLNSMER